jgi:hypothetical protein
MTTSRAAHYPGKGFCLVAFPTGNERQPEPVALGAVTFFQTMAELKATLASHGIALLPGGRIA